MLYIISANQINVKIKLCIRIDWPLISRDVLGGNNFMKRSPELFWSVCEKNVCAIFAMFAACYVFLL